MKRDTKRQPVGRCGHGCALSWRAWSGAGPTRGTCLPCIALAATPDHTSTVPKSNVLSLLLKRFQDGTRDGRTHHGRTSCFKTLCYALLLCIGLHHAMQFVSCSSQQIREQCCMCTAFDCPAPSCSLLHKASYKVQIRPSCTTAEPSQAMASKLLHSAES